FVSWDLQGGDALVGATLYCLGDPVIVVDVHRDVECGGRYIGPYGLHDRVASGDDLRPFRLAAGFGALAAVLALRCSGVRLALRRMSVTHFRGGCGAFSFQA